MKIINPANESLVRELDEDNAQTVAKKFARAREGQKAWAKRPLGDRIAILRKFRDSAVAKKEELARTLTSETGKPISQARNELNALTGRIDFFLNEAEGVLREEQ